MVGCKASNVFTVSTYDEQYDKKQEERYTEIKEYLSDEYSDDLDEIKKDDLYDEYSQLFVQYGIGNSDYSQSRRNKFSGTVDLENHTIRYSDEVIDYEYTADGVNILHNDSAPVDDTFIRMVYMAEDMSKEKKEANYHLLLSAGWLPVATFFIGLLA